MVFATPTSSDTSRFAKILKEDLQFFKGTPCVCGNTVLGTVSVQHRHRIIRPI